VVGVTARCELCGIPERERREVHYSHERGARCCLSCHLDGPRDHATAPSTADADAYDELRARENAA
jgi:hypothetical protein